MFIASSIPLTTATDRRVRRVSRTQRSTLSRWQATQHKPAVAGIGGDQDLGVNQMSHDELKDPVWFISAGIKSQLLAAAMLSTDAPPCVRVSELRVSLRAPRARLSPCCSQVRSSSQRTRPRRAHTQAISERKKTKPFCVVFFSTKSLSSGAHEGGFS